MGFGVFVAIILTAVAFSGFIGFVYYTISIIQFSISNHFSIKSVWQLLGCALILALGACGIIDLCLFQKNYQEEITKLKFPKKTEEKADLPYIEDVVFTVITPDGTVLENLRNGEFLDSGKVKFIDSEGRTIYIAGNYTIYERVDYIIKK